MRRINPTKAALSVGIVVGLWHALWVTLVATGFAKPVMNFILRLHFLQFDYGIAPFSLSIAATLVGLTFAVGAIFGLIFALVWNWLGAQAAASGGAKPQPAE
jgi:hypothetical protein